MGQSALPIVIADVLIIGSIDDLEKTEELFIISLLFLYDSNTRNLSSWDRSSTIIIGNL